MASHFKSDQSGNAQNNSSYGQGANNPYGHGASNPYTQGNSNPYAQGANNPYQAQAGSSQAQAQAQAAQPHKNHHERARENTSLLYDGLANSPKNGSHHSGSHHHGSHHHSRRKKSKAPVIIAVIAILAILVAAGVSGFALLNSAKSLKSEASQVLEQVDTIQEQVVSGDYAGAASTVASMQTTSATMQDELNSPLWSVASALPVVGSDIQGVKTMASVLSQVSTDVLPALTNQLQATSGVALVTDGTLNLAAIQPLLSAVQETAPTMQTCADQMANVPSMNIGQLQSTVDKAKEKFAAINDLYQAGANLAPLANKLLGGEGTRTYLIAAQNSAEMRSTGGFPGSMGLLTIENGQISLGAFGTPYDLLQDTTSVALTDEEYTLFNNGYVDINCPRDTSVIIDFTRTAKIWAQAYADKNATQVDGVISVVPSVVQDLLSLTNSITLSDGTVLDGTNATKVLEHELYWKYFSNESTAANGGEISDALFAEAADAAFHNVLSNLSMSTIKGFGEVLAKDAADGSIMVWLTNEAEQETLSALGCSGALGGTEQAPEIGVYVGLITGSKLGWYLDCDTEVSAGAPNADGSYSYEVKVTLHNALTSAEAATAGTYIAGVWGGSIDPLMYLTAPAGGSISNVVSSDGTTFETATYEGIQVAYNPSNIWLDCDATTTITYTVTTSAAATEALSVHTTPTLTQYRS